jgi:hypothetical protein
VHLALALVAVLVYAPASGGAGDRRSEIQAAIETAAGEVDVHALRAALADQAGGWVRADQLAFFEQAKQKAEEGRRLLERVELEAAERAFLDAEKIYEAHLGWPGVASAWSQVALWRGVGAFERGQAPLAKKLFQRAVALDPSSKLTEASARPDVVRAFADANKPRASVKFSVDSHGEVSVDGKPAAGEVSLGEHVVLVRAPERLPQAVLVEVQGPMSLALEPVDDPVRLALDSLKRAPTAEGLEALAKLRGLDGIYLAAASIDAGEPTLVGERVDSKGCATSAIALRGRSLDKLAGTFLERLRDGEARCPASPAAILEAPAIAHPRPAPPVVVEKPKIVPKKKRFWERPWLWVGLLAITTAGVAVGAALAPANNSYKANIDQSGFGITH